VVKTEIKARKPPEEILQWNKVKWRKKLLVSVATEGWVRFEWAHARYGQITPINWECTGYDVSYAAIGYSIDDAYNLITKKALELNVDWLITIEDDVLIPPNLYLKFSEYMDKGDVPIVSGLYYTKSEPAQPLLFRGRGTGAFHDWELGQKVWVDGLPMGCLLIHTSILKWMSDNSESYRLPDGGIVKRVFETPRRMFYDPEKGIQRQEGTQDLFFFDRLIEYDVLQKTGWKRIAKREYPFLCDTSIFCKHICRNTGRQYP